MGLKFTTDRLAGERTEYLILSWVKVKYKTAHKIKGNHKEYDIKVPEANITIEVKDQSNSRTHFFIETECYGKPSGISTTTSDYFIFYRRGELYIVETPKLRCYLFSLDRGARPYSNLDGNSWGYTVPAKDIKKIGLYSTI